MRPQHIKTIAIAHIDSKQVRIKHHSNGEQEPRDTWIHTYENTTKTIIEIWPKVRLG